MFVAQGHGGRTTVSCDDGYTWVGNQSSDDALRCFEGIDCDHRFDAARGIIYGDGYFFATYGWGPPGGIERSRDGLTWETVREGTAFSGMSVGSDLVVAGSRFGEFSDDLGETWQAIGDPMLTQWNVRSSAFVPAAGGLFIMVADGPELTLSADAVSWWRPDTFPNTCGQGMHNKGSILYGNGAIVIVGGNGVACRSIDGGRNWTDHRFADSSDSDAVWTGSQFMVWGAGQRYSSTDGATWTATPTVPSGMRINAVAASDTGTLVAVSHRWLGWYEAQEFYRSEDGVNWTALPESNYVGSHPIWFIAFGHGATSDLCPAR